MLRLGGAKTLKTDEKEKLRNISVIREGNPDNKICGKTFVNGDNATVFTAIEASAV